MRTFIAICVVVTASATLAVEPQPHAHAHNDYEHDRPLLDALSHGFCSVEADVFAIDDELQVAHDRPDAKPGRNLRTLYLDPLRQRVQKNNGRVFKDGPQFTLLIDFKSAAEPTYRVLRRVLADYRDLFVAQPGQEEAAISVVVSGNRPFAAIEADRDRLCGIDGRLSNLDSKMSRDLLPMISDNWSIHFKWLGNGEIPAEERAKLQDAVHRAHDAGRRIRFWATPENERLWQELLDAGVDHINTDQLARLEKFLKTQLDRTR